MKAVKNAALGNLNTRYIDENLNLHLIVCTLLDPIYKDMVIDYNIKTKALNSIIVSAIAIQDTTQLQSVPVKSETGAVPEALPQLPTLPTALIEQAVVPKNKYAPDAEIPTKKLKVESVIEDSFLDDWFSDMFLLKKRKGFLVSPKLLGVN